MSSSGVPADASPGVLQLLRDLAHELSAYARDAARLLAEELRVQSRTLGLMAALALAGLVFAGTAFLLLSLAVVAGVARLVNGWGLSLLLVGVLYTLLAGILGWAMQRVRRTQPLHFPGTLERLRSDTAYFKSKMAA